MLENPGDELYFGEVYRTILQEAWLPEGAQEWSRVGKSRRGRRPTQQGTGAQSPTPSQADIRLCFSMCSANWRQLPWSYPPDHPCYGTATKDFWLDEKINKAIPCSYYDYYMRCCMSYCLQTGCILPEANCYVWDPASTQEIGFPFRLRVYVIGGTPPFYWTVNDPPFWLTFVITTSRENSIAIRTDTCGIANIKVTDDCGRVVEGVVTTETVSWPYLPPIWSPDNPEEISPDSEEVISVEEGAEPYTWEVTGEDFFFAEDQTSDECNTLIAGPDACGTAHISVTDCLGSQVTGKVRSTEGQWVFKGAYCGLTAAGEATQTDLGGNDLGYEYIKDNRKQTHTYDYRHTDNYYNCAARDCVRDYCQDPPGIECQPCLDWSPEYGVPRVPCYNAPGEGLPDRSVCGVNHSFAYSEWEC